MKRVLCRMVVCGVIATFCALQAIASDDEIDTHKPWAVAEEIATEKSTFGLNQQIYMIDGSEFVPTDGAGYLDGGSWAWTLKNSADMAIVTQVNLPAGAQINRLACVMQDDDPVYYPGWSLLRKEWSWPVDSAVSGTTLQFMTADYDDSNWRAYYVDWNEVIVNYSSPDYYIYVLVVSLLSDNPDINFWGCLILWERTLSPAPGAATFNDVPVGAFGFQHVEALAASGITAGCGGGNFCPDDPLTRVQMAVFLAKALGLHWPG
jgi:hypothetical protein